LQRWVQTEEIEVAVGDFYTTHVRLDEEDCRAIREGLRSVLDTRRKEAMPAVAAAREQIEGLEQQRRRVARGLVDGSLPADLAREEQDRIRTELAAAQLLVSKAETKFADIEKPLLRALELVGQCDRLYTNGNSRVRRLCNQAFFRQLRIRDAEVAEGELAEPWRTLHDPVVMNQLRSAVNQETAEFSFSGSSFNNDYVAPPAGFEPAWYGLEVRCLILSATGAGQLCFPVWHYRCLVPISPDPSA
jgi:site-specific DNA recombinase